MGWFFNAPQNKTSTQSKCSTERMHSHAASRIKCFKYLMDQLLIQCVANTAQYAHEEYLRGPRATQHDSQCNQLRRSGIQCSYKGGLVDIDELVAPSGLKDMSPKIRE